MYGSKIYRRPFLLGRYGVPLPDRDPEGKFAISFLNTEKLPIDHLEGIWWNAQEMFSLTENLT